MPVGAALSASGPWTCQVGVGFDDSHEQVHQDLAFCGIQDGENLLLTLDRLRADLGKQLLASSGEPNESSSTIAIIDSSFDESFGLEASDEQAGGVAIDTESRRDCALVEV